MPDRVYTTEFLPWRGLTKATMEKFNVKTRITEDGKPFSVVLPYQEGTAKVRLLASKTFFAEGEMSKASLFGMDKFDKASAQAITITEGEIDALSVFQMLGSKYPVVSVRSASSARKDCEQSFDYLNSFGKIYLCLDNDEPGRLAARAIAGLFDFNKVYDVTLQRKDANEYLTANEGAAFTRIWWNSRRLLPEGIISSFREMDEIIDADVIRRGADYPFPTLNRMTYGLRPRETVLFTALEGIGKTEVLRAIEYHLLRNTTAAVGVMHFEEDKARTYKGFAGYYLETPAHLPDAPVSNEDVKKALRTVLGADERLHIYSHFDSDDPDVVLDTIRFMAGPCGCKFIFLDHISWLVSALETDDERKKLDYISTRLATMAKDRDFSLVFVSHVNDDGLTRGSRNISKVANLWVHLHRDITAASPIERNVTTMTIRKNRFASHTGPAGRLFFNPETFMLKEMFDAPEPVPAA